MMLVIIFWIEVGHCMHETEYKTVSGPVNDDVNGHVVGIQSNFVSLIPRRSSSAMSKGMADSRKTRVSHTGNAPMQKFTFKHTAKILLRRRALVGMDKFEEGLANKHAGLVLQVGLEYRVQIDKIQPRRQKRPITPSFADFG
jgi:hypothetical protein